MNTDAKNVIRYFQKICQSLNTKRKKHIPVRIVKAGVYREYTQDSVLLPQKRVNRLAPVPNSANIPADLVVKLLHQNDIQR